MTWSPTWARVASAMSIAAMPEATATAAVPPSSWVMRCSSTAWVGLLVRA
ncbi:Uncharacterised protein [Comamonas aquatica]|nr:Uncharacterised protein [Comamonas aquatica]